MPEKSNFDVRSVSSLISLETFCRLSDSVEEVETEGRERELEVELFGMIGEGC